MLDRIITIVREAGEIHKKYFSKEYNTSYKNNEGRSPVTDADIEADRYIREVLHDQFPHDKILSEENGLLPSDFSGRVWMVDPLDGTRYFIEGKKGFSVTIGLCTEGVPVLGVVYFPMKNELYFAEKRRSAWLLKNGLEHRLAVSNVEHLADARKIMQPAHRKRPMDKLVISLGKENVTSKGGFSYKACVIASGNAEFHFATSPNTCKWDTCATQVIVEEAGGKITDKEGNPIDYMQKDSALNHPIISNGFIHDELIEEMKKNS